MANIKSNEKRYLQNEKKHLLNHMQMSKLKTQIKKTKASKDSKDLAKSYQLIDSSVSKGIISQNKANRLKSRLSINVATAPTEKTEATKKRSVSTRKKTTTKKTTSKK